MSASRRPIRTVLLAAIVMVVALAALAITGDQWLGYLHSFPAAEPQAPPASSQAPPPPAQPTSAEQSTDPQEDPRFVRARERMVREDLTGPGRDITDNKVLEVMGRVPRQLFVPPEIKDEAYDDNPLRIGHEQTISQPYIVALMTQLVEPKAESRALDVGTGSGYQAAVLAEICKEVYSIEIVEALAAEATKRLADLGYKNITVRYGDGYRGWPDKAPFDVIIVAAAPGHVPQPLVDQLAPGGKLVLPVGGRFYQQLIVIEKDKKGKVHRKPNIPVMFVPMTGEAQRRQE